MNVSILNFFSLFIDDNEDEDEEVAAQFKLCKNKLEICNWLVKRPEILNLANKMLELKKNPVNAPSTASPPAPVGPIDRVSSDNKLRLWDESIKCLFLRCRNPPLQALDELV